MIIVMTLYYSVIFEFILPKFSLKYTADYYDVLCYGIGAILFYYHQKKLTSELIT